MLFVLACPQFDPKVTDALSAFRARHEPARARLVPPHITLVFGIPTTARADIQRLCQQAAAHMRRVPITFDRCEIAHDPIEKTEKLFLMVSRGRPELTSLHTQLYDGPHRAQFIADIPFRPHMTVATHTDPAVVHNIDTGALGTLPITGTVHDLTLVSFQDRKLTLIDTVPLMA